MRTTSSVDVIALKHRMVQQRLDRICDLSNASGVSKPTIGNILAGRIQPSTDVINRLMRTLNLSPSEAGVIFFGGNSEGGKN